MFRSVSRLVGLGVGAVYVLVDLLRFVVSGHHAFAGARDGHLLVGAGVIGAAAGPAAAKKVNNAVGAVYLLVGVLGVVISGCATGCWPPRPTPANCRRKPTTGQTNCLTNAAFLKGGR